MPFVRKRRSEAISESDAASPTPPPANRRRRQRQPSSSDGEVSDPDARPAQTQIQTQDEGTRDQMAKKLVRMALACEYARLPIRRADVGTKVLGETGARQFKHVFEAAQKELREVFGMEMMELPTREKTGLNQRRAAATVASSQKANTTSKSWVLTSVLPKPYSSDPDILIPPRAPSSAAESNYTGFYTFIIALISLSGGALPEAKLDRYLKRVNADQYFALERTDKYLARMIKEGYLIRERDTSTGEEIIVFHVGPRGRVEVGDEGISGLVRTVYGTIGLDVDDEGPEQNAAGKAKGQIDAAELERKLARSLGIEEKKAKQARDKVKMESKARQAASQKAERTNRGRGRPRRSGGDSDEEGDVVRSKDVEVEIESESEEGSEEESEDEEEN